MKNVTLKNLVFCLFCLIWNVSNAQIATIKFELYNDNAVFLKLPINNEKDSLVFFFDTGATTALIDSTAAKKIGLKSNYVAKVSGASGDKNYKVLLNQSIRINDKVKVEGVHFVFDDLTRLQSTSGRKFDGIVGYNILNSFKTKVDFDKKEIQLFPFEEKIDTSGYSSIDFKFNNGITIPQFPITIELKNGQKFTDTILFDSGAAAVTLLINKPFKDKNQLTQNMGKILKSENQNLSSKSITEDAAVKSLQIGDFKFGELCVSLSSDKEGVSSYENYLGLMGSEIINRFNLILDYSAHKLYLKPNHLYDKKFTFPLSGIKLKMEKSEIVISSVVEGTDAYKKGLRENLKIISINGIRSNDIDTYREFLKKENTTVVIECLSADGKTVKAKLKLKRLL